MKRITAVIVTLVMCAACHAQINFTKMIKEVPEDLAEKYDFYNVRTAKLRTAAVGSAAVSVGCFVAYALQKEKFEIKDNKDVKMKQTPKALLIGGSVAAVAALTCELFAIDSKLKSGKCLKLSLAGNTANVSFKF